MTTKSNDTPRNPNPRRKPMQAFFFLRSLARMSRRTAAAPLRRRFRAIRSAAYASMARAASPRCSWRRAVLARLLRQSRPLRAPLALPPRAVKPDGADELRRVVPGGEGMGFGRLLKETVDYVEALKLQVQLMQTMVAHHMEDDER
ncbi:Transcription factor bHLH148 [Apostasia shenzhenica]|uniref:Transcription factor bHLH148 n=1 Tax=Apostasia shenzhenica TaxID=1088818 RepID=A0A2I0BEC4_9ASPA|nr:Transcription factor bHLH148 [Apostasia shenzhenica]